MIAVFLCVRNYDISQQEMFHVLYQSPFDTIPGLSGLPMGANIQRYPHEIALYNGLVELINRFDPDLVVGYETQNSSLGYLCERGAELDVDLPALLSRIRTKDTRSEFARPDHAWSKKRTTGLTITGRIVLSLWQVLRSEVTTTIYTYENICYQVLHHRVPHYPASVLTHWYPLQRHTGLEWRTAQYYLEKTQMLLKIMDRLEVVERTSELARFFGIDFYAVLSRGSQYRVESILVRVCKAHNYVLLSPPPEQRFQQNAPECIPLVMEPESGFYVDPVVVLDFQSLYPSIIIGYNYCYSTALGRLAPNGTAKKFGVTRLEYPEGFLTPLKNQINVSPNEVMFTKPNVRSGVLPRILQEILDARVMVKDALKRAMRRGDKYTAQKLNARQLGLKFIANVTYGYTGASGSGRMPCVDIADSIVQTGRETLESAVRLIQGRSDWGARVVYGDTDSLFVQLPGRTRAEAFAIGQEIADTVTSVNPAPVKLKLEKVYQPCILATKKRYVGFSYESPDQAEPKFDAKGIETIRRDTCPAVAKIVEKSLKILFTDKDLTQVRAYLERQWGKILSGRVSIKDFIFAKEVKLGSYSARAPPPHAVHVVNRKMSRDPRAEPRFKERVPYLVAQGQRAQPLYTMVYDPQEFLTNPEMTLNADYYIKNQVPANCLTL